MIRAGMIRKVASGIYSLLPIGQKVIQKMMTIIREEMNRAGAQEVFLPSIVPSQLWEESGRWGQYGPELLRIKDRHGNDYCYGPTHEEVITEMVRGTVKSYRQLPINLYQIQTKFRDEIRPRFGLMRGREFMMKDAYSFHANDDDLRATYDQMAIAYARIFERCGLKFKMVEADSGNIGGSKSAEFMVTAESGEDLIIECDTCAYAANIEAAIAPDLTASVNDNQIEKRIEKIATPDQRTIDEVSTELNIPKSKLIKSLIVMLDNQIPVMVLIRGDHELNETKLKRCLNADEVSFIDETIVQTISGAVPGFAGPIGLKPDVKIVADLSVQGIRQGVIGANELGFHLTNVNLSRDCNVEVFYDLRNAVEGDLCSRCNTGQYRYARGIEVGHIFQLGTKYSASMNAVFLDQNGKTQPFVMGCYGIGVGRTVAAAIEQSHDDKGILWPSGLAPFQVVIVLGNAKYQDQVDAANRIYQTLQENGIDCLYDDRAVSIGVKFNDFELIGIPIAIVVGKNYTESATFEIKFRDGRESVSALESDLLSVIVNK